MKDKNAFLVMTAQKTYGPELATMRQTQKASAGLRI